MLGSINIDKDTLIKLALNGSPIAKAVALTLLDEMYDGKIIAELKRILKEKQHSNSHLTTLQTV
ncbi:hypothetical protein AFULGI_00017110 [Archaeoglobus fulgidus DSM 8774]|jgi:hypothetical protein|uniref:Uncharacterized protein n=1 Tax=Archaeoglobus fulgidus DSM 8774 TaxID=1344584 RepID=A0A075WDG3_ARCFL|nr:hypothetical protein [Archaeoglobus fulgidus]AIG98470.1 hypothetical protein AFULGI_00017110 [Archaeoglobus fulgidus DSM 8774]